MASSKHLSNGMRSLIKLMSVGFVVNEANKCAYYRFGGGEGVILCLYVDDILIFGTSLNMIKEVKEFLS